MRNTFLISTAAVALVAGMGLASAQAPTEQRQPPAASGQMGAPAGGGGQMAPEASKPAGAEQKGQAQKGDQKSGTSAQSPEKAPAQDKAAGGARTEPSGQAQSQDKGKMQDKGQAQSQDKAKGQAQSQDDKGKNAQSGGAKPDAKSANVTLTTEQKTKIRETVIKSSNAPRVTNVNFSISVGTVIPRTVRFAPLPTVIVEYYPAWRGYDYFIVGEQIIIVEPRTLRIVAILDV